MRSYLYCLLKVSKLTWPSDVSLLRLLFLTPATDDPILSVIMNKA
jgi:hypothetical protein